MGRYILRRVLIALPTMLGVTIVAFLMIHLIPGNIVQVMLGTRTDVTPQQIHQLYRLYGINQPLYIQYWHWLSQLLTGNLGFSLRTGLPIAALINQSFGVTAELALGALVLAVVVAVPLGMIAALYQNTVWDYLARGLALFGLIIPNFWLGTMLVMLTSVYLPVLSVFNYVPLLTNPVLNLKDMIVPIFTLALSLMAIITRMTRSAVLETVQLDHVRTARAKGLKDLVVNLRHVLRNSLIPITTIVGLQLGYLLGGAIVVENVFSLPGMGRLIVDAINQRDYPVVQSSILFVSAIFVLVNLVVDISYGFINPQIRYQ
ncbi:MAG: hypothetical protein C7B46_14555 [Sulfobacillus benefaciens]|uniref:ABC transmembrane type-1 domain-containing protein n=1 Tax=Sulfobacillus benefaciens TaxID=453960 RepID=A0A2T2XCX4_9FIRM|nr:MAG: hypothetical protein C7B46_14555 [Sulfobacillus benefaciens]